LWINKGWPILKNVVVLEDGILHLFDPKKNLILKSAQSNNRTFKTQLKAIEYECLAATTESKDSDYGIKGMDT
jgi:hypothetical protein